MFYKSSNSVIANLSTCDSFTLNNLRSKFCSSLYGVEFYISVSITIDPKLCKKKAARSGKNATSIYFCFEYMF